MSQRRMIDESMWSNEDFAGMPMGARLLQIGMINHADDQGRLKANPAYLSSRIFPYDDDVSSSDVQKWLDAMQKNETIILYEVDGKQYAQLVNWWKYQKHQYAQPSEYPRPDGWKDRIRKTHTKGMIVTCNWLKVNEEPIEDTCDQDGKPLLQAKGINTPVDDDELAPDEPYVDEDYSPEYSGEGTNIRSRSSIRLRSIEDQGEDQHAGACGAHAEQPTAPPLDAAQPEYLPGLPDPRKRNDVQRGEIAERFSEAKQLGLTSEQYRVLVDALLLGFGKKAMVDAGNDKALHHAQAVTLEVMRMSENFRSVEGIQSVFQSWKADDWRGQKGELPTSEQFKEHASKMVDGVISKQDKPVLTFKKWLVKEFNTDYLAALNVPEEILRQRYEQSIRVH